jgi:N-acylneuraminate cytidylyltransferase
MSVVAIIPARGGSVRIPGKNIKLFHGKPIISYSIEAALKCGSFDDVFVSTDSAEIGHIAAQYGARPLYREYCDGTKGTQELAREILKEMPEVELACVIYATSPMIDSGDVAVAGLVLRKLNKKNRSNCFVMSVGSNPLRDAAQFYWGYSRAFMDGAPLIHFGTRMYPVDESRICDINTEEDWLKAEQMYAKLKGIA